MMPMAEELFKLPLPRAETSVVRNMLSGCQYFDARSYVEEAIHCVKSITHGEMINDLIASNLPSSRSWFQVADDYAVLLSDRMPEAHRDIRFHAIFFGRAKGGNVAIFRHILNDGVHFCEMGGLQRDAFSSEHWTDVFSTGLRFVSLVLTGLSAPRGFCHQVARAPSRQAARAALRSGRPCHKWVEIRLGRAPGERRARADGGEPRRGVAWHFRRGHMVVNHPNPKLNKWRRGGMVGSPDHGIRSAKYIIDPDGWLDD